MYALAQGSAELKGLTLHTETALEQCHDLQQLASDLARKEARRRDRRREVRVELLALATVGLWLAILVMMLVQA